MAKGEVANAIQPDGGWVVRPAWSHALCVTALAQCAAWLWLDAWSMSLVGLGGGFAAQASGLIAAYRLIKPNKIIYLRDSHLMVCDLSGRCQAKIDAPVGFVSPFFIGLALGRFRHLGVFASQLSSAQFGALLRWARWS